MLQIILSIYLSYHRATVCQFGVASYYADKFENRLTANQERFKQSGLTAAHLKLPFGTKVLVINLSNLKSVILRINDRGPFHKKRIIDVTSKVAELLDFKREGLANVVVISFA